MVECERNRKAGSKENNCEAGLMITKGGPAMNDNEKRLSLRGGTPLTQCRPCLYIIESAPHPEGPHKA